MDNCAITSNQLLPDNYIVQSIENIPLSMIDYDKIEMTHAVIHSGQLTTGTVIQLTNLSSNLNVKSKELHPLEAEIQRDFELKQQQQQQQQHYSTLQQPLVKLPTSSVIQCLPQTSINHCTDKSKFLETNSLFDGVFQSMCNERETVLNINKSKRTENILCQIPGCDRQLTEKRQNVFSDKLIVDNVDSKTNDYNSRNTHNDVVNVSKNHVESEILNVPIIENDSSISKQNKSIVESDSETEEHDIEPVCDYEPDPETTDLKSEKNEKPHKCYVCFRSFRHKKNMYAHIRTIHSIQPKIEGGILCPLCKMHALRQEHLRNHLETLHNIKIEKEEKLFNTIDEFLIWKESIEKETISFYVSKSSSKLLANNQQKTYYKCHRSGNYVTDKKEGRKKKLKAQGSNKIGATCPSAMEVTENLHGIHVLFWKTHVGHENDLAHSVLSKKDRARILDYMASGISCDKVLDNLREDAKASLTPSRLTILSMQDLRNVKKMYDTKTRENKEKVVQARTHIKERLSRKGSQSLIIEKADLLLNLLKNTEIKPEFRPKICLMIDNLISTVKRRAIKISKIEVQKMRRQDKCKLTTHLHKVDGREPRNKRSLNSNNVIFNEESHFGSNTEKVSCRKSKRIKSSKRLN